jgi:hypothetical protein
MMLEFRFFGRLRAILSAFLGVGLGQFAEKLSVFHR